MHNKLIQILFKEIIIHQIWLKWINFSYMYINNIKKVTVHIIIYEFAC